MFDFSHFYMADVDGDGTIDEFQGPDGAVLSVKPGSPEAKELWNNVEQQAHSPENVARAKALTGSMKAKGMFLEKPLVPGPGPNQGDFDFLVNKLHWHDGHPWETAKKIASSIKNKLYGGK